MNYDHLTLEEFRKLSDKDASKVPRAVLEKLFDELESKDKGWVYDQQRFKKINSKSFSI